MTHLRLGISTCPNDTFAFHGLLSGAVSGDLTFEISLLDVEELNRGIRAGAFDVAKASFATALELTEQWGVLPSGSAVGYGVGPVLLARDPNCRPGTRTGDPPRRARVLLPGVGTTASLLYQLIHGTDDERVQVVFHEIMPGLTAGRADLGVCIHEGRFTYQQVGLHLIEDLGATWESRTEAPLPLGGIVARRDLGDDVLRSVQDLLRRSIDHAHGDRAGALRTMRAHAQELDDDVIWRHVELYVNSWTLDLGAEGLRALSVLSNEARKAGLIPTTAPPLEIVGR